MSDPAAGQGDDVAPSRSSAKRNAPQPGLYTTSLAQMLNNTLGARKEGFIMDRLSRQSNRVIRATEKAWVDGATLPHGQSLFYQVQGEKSSSAPWAKATKYADNHASARNELVCFDVKTEGEGLKVSATQRCKDRNGLARTETDSILRLDLSQGSWLDSLGTSRRPQGLP
jgi:hypothetical protein